MRLQLVELDLHDSVRVEEDVRDLVEADHRPVGEGDVDAVGEGRLAFPERLSSVRVDLPVRAEPGDPVPGRVRRPIAAGAPGEQTMMRSGRTPSRAAISPSV